MAEPLLSSPPGWNRSTLAPGATDPNAPIASALTGATPKTGEESYWDGEHPWLTPREVSRRPSGLWFTHTERTLTSEGIRSCSLRLFPASTVLLTKRAPVGSVALNAIPMAVNQGFIALTCTDQMRPLYLAHWLLANRKYLQQVANGSTYPELYVGDLYEFEIYFPSVQEQDNILNVLSSLEFGLQLVGPLEQSSMTPSQLVDLETDKRSLRSVVDDLRVLLLQGSISAAEVSARTRTAS